MKLPISKRLLLCTELITSCDTVADVGTDHGYLGIYLLRQGICRHVIASDLREKPLASARANAALFGVQDRITFLQSDGLESIQPGSFQTLVLAGMGGDLIARILEQAPWLKDEGVTLILQPQSAMHDLRRLLSETGWHICRERLARDGHFLYAVMEAKPGQGSALTPAEQYLSPALRQSGDPLFAQYEARMILALERTVAGIEQSKDPADLEKLDYYRAALQELSAQRERSDLR